VTSCGTVVGYQRFGRPYCYTLKMEAARSSETLVSYYNTTQRRNLEFESSPPWKKNTLNPSVKITCVGSDTGAQTNKMVSVPISALAIRATSRTGLHSIRHLQVHRASTVRSTENKTHDMSAALFIL